MEGQLGGDENLTPEEEEVSRRLLAERLQTVNARKPQTFEVKVCARMKPVPAHEMLKGEAGPQHFHQCRYVHVPHRCSLCRNAFVG